MYNWFTLLYTWNYHNIVNQLYFNFKKKRLPWWPWVGLGATHLLVRDNDINIYANLCACYPVHCGRPLWEQGPHPLFSPGCPVPSTAPAKKGLSKYLFECMIKNCKEQESVLHLHTSLTVLKPKQAVLRDAWFGGVIYNTLEIKPLVFETWTFHLMQDQELTDWLLAGQRGL